MNCPLVPIYPPIFQRQFTMSQVKQRKVALMGFRSVGKSSLAIQFVQGQFVDSYDPTIENTFNKSIKVKNQEFELFVVDTAGQDEYRFRFFF